MAKKNLRQGFLLIELLIGLLLFLVFIYIMQLYQMHIIRINYEAIHRYKALMLINSFMSTIIYQPEILNKQQYTHPDGIIRWSNEPFPFDVPITNPPLVSKARCLHLTVSWLGWHKEQRSLSTTAGIII